VSVIQLVYKMWWGRCDKCWAHCELYPLYSLIETGSYCPHKYCAWTCCWEWKKLRSSTFNDSGQKCNQETPTKSGFIFPRNHRDLVVEKAHWALFLLHFHVLHVLMGMLHETCWHQRDSQTDKSSEHLSSRVSGPLSATRHLFIVPSASSNKTSRNPSW